MSAFGVRSRGYQAGVLLLFVSTILFVIGLVSPMWLHYERDVLNIREESSFAGVFVGCQYKLSRVGAKSFDFTRCGFGFAYAFENMKDMGDWVHAVETFEILSAIALIFACIYGATINCFTIYPGTRTRILEITTGVAGTVAFIFTMVFVGKLRFEVERDVFYTFSWAFYLTVVSSIAAVVAALLIGLFNEYVPPPSDDFYVNGHNASFSKPPLNESFGYSSRHDELYDPRVTRLDMDDGDGGGRRGAGGGGGGRRGRGGANRYESDM